MKKLLNIDGGGVRVYFSLLILNYIEEKTGKEIIDLFDYYSGVSASSILLSCLLTKHKLKNIINLFKDFSKKVFYRSYYQMITSGFGLFYSKYDDTMINAELQLLFAGYRLCDLKKPMSILTFDLLSNKSKSFHSITKDKDEAEMNLWEIVRGSTAAPTYFDPHTVKNIFERDGYNYRLIDGGVVTNNLSESIFIDALSHFGEKESYYQISLGTGTYIPNYNNLSSGVIGWSGPIIDIFFAASSSYEMETLKNISKFDNLKMFHRIDINLEQDIKLDDCNAFINMDSIFENWLEKNRNYLDTICEELLELV
jgi:patatin-like phospholipase/acyl hydrolase